MLEEDYGLLPDVFQVETLLELATKVGNIPTWKREEPLIVLGNYKSNLKLDEMLTKDESAGWTFGTSIYSSSENNMGMVFNKQIIKKLFNNFKNDFCFYDDYNWDYTLMHISNEIEKLVFHYLRVV